MTDLQQENFGQRQEGEKVGKPYDSELAALPETYLWASSLSVGRLPEALAAVAQVPLICVGSGGSLTTAHFAALLHSERTGHLARPSTPLEVASSHLNLRELGILLISARGGNPDVIGAFKQIVAREPRHLVVLCARTDSALSRLASGYRWVRIFDFDLPSGKDGFLATNSLLASVVILKRAYDATGGSTDPLPSSLAELLHDDHGSGVSAEELAAQCRLLWERETLTVLHGPALQPAAVDLESRFTEAALGHIQIADYRNFAHGRHHWLARHGDRTAVLSLENAEDRALAERTLALLPTSVPTVRFPAPGTGAQACLSGLVFGLHLAGMAGRARNIDPGAPHVPSFGREIYHLQAFGPRSRRRSASSREQLAIERKTGAGFPQLAVRGDLDFWRSAYQVFTRQLQEAAFKCLALDYDGTLCNECEKATGLGPDVAQQLMRLLTAGVRVGIATGRGESVRGDLRKAIPRPLWDLVIVGYRNGAEIAELADDSCPSQTDEVGEELDSVARRIMADTLLKRLVGRTRPRWKQISIYPNPGVHVRVVWQRLCEIACDVGHPGIKVVQSSHSIDVIAPGVSKRVIVDRLGDLQDNSPSECCPLCVGDRGRWPGNDFEFLQGPHSLSVDEVSTAPDSCWLLSSPGARGVQSMLEYFAGLLVEDGAARLRF